MTDAQIMARLIGMKAPAKRELAAKIGYTERSVYLWVKKGKLPKNKIVRAALEKALGAKR